MVRTQIQLPDDVFAKAKRLCEAKGMSFDELVCRGIEAMLSVYPQKLRKDEWQLPKPRNLGWMGLSHAEFKQQSKHTI